jgi:hypothetical protein
MAKGVRKDRKDLIIISLTLSALRFYPLEL